MTRSLAEQRASVPEELKRLMGNAPAAVQAAAAPDGTSLAGCHAAMSTFAFRAVDLAGVPSRGEIEAGSKAQVSDQLRQRGLIVLDVSEQRESVKLESAFKRFTRSTCETSRSSHASTRR